MRYMTGTSVQNERDRAQLGPEERTVPLDAPPAPPQSNFDAPGVRGSRPDVGISATGRRSRRRLGDQLDADLEAGVGLDADLADEVGRQYALNEFVASWVPTRANQ